MRKSGYLLFPYANELLRIQTDALLYVKAAGNYTLLRTIDGKERELVLQLGQIEQMTSEVKSASRKFIRIGRSLIVNRDFITYINISKQKIELSDNRSFSYNVTASKEALRKLKDFLIEESENDYVTDGEMDDNEIRVIVFHEKETVREDKDGNKTQVSERKVYRLGDKELRSMLSSIKPPKIINEYKRIGSDESDFTDYEEMEKK